MSDSPADFGYCSIFTHQKRFLREIVLVELVELLGGYIPRRNRGDIDAKGA